VIEHLCVSTVSPNARLNNLPPIDPESLQILMLPVSEHIVPYNDLSLWIVFLNVFAHFPHEFRVQCLLAGFLNKILTLLTRGHIEDLVCSNVDVGFGLRS